MADTIEKIYVVRAEGTGPIIKDLRTINQLFKDLAKSKASLEAEKGLTDDPAKIKQIDDAITHLTATEVKLTAEKQSRLDAARQEVATNGQLIGTYEQMVAQINSINNANAAGGGGVAGQEGAAAIQAVTAAQVEMATATQAGTVALNTQSAAIQGGLIYQQQEEEKILSLSEAQAILNAEAEENIAAVQERAAVTAEMNASMQETVGIIAEEDAVYEGLVGQIQLANQAMAQTNAELKALEAAYKEGTITEQQYADQTALLTKNKAGLSVELQTLNAELKTEQGLMLTTENSIDEARALVKLYTKERNALNLSTEEGTARQRELNRMIDEQNEFIRTNVDLYQKQKINIGNYPTLAAELKAIRNEMEQLALAGQKDSVAFQQLATRAQTLTVSMGEAAAATKATQATQSALATGATKAFSALRMAANILPGIGIAGIFGILIDGVTKATAALIEYAAEAVGAAAATKRLNDAMFEGTKAATDSVVSLDHLYAATQNAALSEEQRIAAMKKLQELWPEHFASIERETFLNGGAKDSYDALKDSILATARAKAIEGQMSKIINDDLSKELAIRKRLQDATDDELKSRGKSITISRSGPEDQGQGQGLRDITIDAVEANKLRLDRIARAKQELADFKATQNEKLRVLNDAADAQDAIRGAHPDIPPGSVAALRKRISDLKAVIELQTIGSDAQKKSTAELIQLEKQLQEIEGRARKTPKAPKSTAKLELQGENELAQASAKLRDQQIQEDIEANQAIFEDDKQTLDARLLAYQNFQSDKIGQAENAAREEIQLNQNLIDSIDTQLADKTKTRSDAEIKALKDRQAAAKINIDAATQALAASTTKINADAAKATKAIVQSDVQTKLDQIGAIRDAAEQEGEARLEKLQESYTKGKISYKKFKEEEQKISNETLITELSNIKTFLELQIAAFAAAGMDTSKLQAALQKTNSELRKAQQKGFGDTAKQVFDLQDFYKKLKDTALNTALEIGEAWVASQQKQIDKDLQLRETKLETEKQLRLDAAQSADEKLAIEQEFTQKQAALQKEKFEADKKLAIKQLAIQFAVASIKAIVAGFDTGGIYGAIAAEALVALEYAAKLAIIESQSFGKGGEVPTEGGEFGGASHAQGGTQFLFKGRAFTAEADELAILNKNTARSGQRYTVSGTAKQIASALNAAGGGVQFAPGARLNRFEYGGSLGSGLSAPYFQPTGGSDIATLAATMQEGFRAVNARQDRMQVVLDPKAVQNSNDRTKKYTQIGQL